MRNIKIEKERETGINPHHILFQCFQCYFHANIHRPTKKKNSPHKTLYFIRTRVPFVMSSKGKINLHWNSLNSHTYIHFSTKFITMTKLFVCLIVRFLCNHIVVMHSIDKVSKTAELEKKGDDEKHHVQIEIQLTTRFFRHARESISVFFPSYISFSLSRSRSRCVSLRLLSGHCFFFICHREIGVVNVLCSYFFFIVHYFCYFCDFISKKKKKKHSYSVTVCVLADLCK